MNQISEQEANRFFQENEVTPAFVGAYTVTRHYGGPEEGGWWYNWYEMVCSSPVESPEEALSEWTRISERLKDWEHGDIYSVLGGVEVCLFLEAEAGDNQTEERPRYS